MFAARDQPAAGAARARAPSRHLRRAVLRSGVRVRDHAALARPAEASHAARRAADRPADGRGVVGLDRHRLDHQLARPATARGADDAVRADAGRAGDVVVDPAGLRGPRRCRSRWPMSRCRSGATCSCCGRSSATTPATIRNFLRITIWHAAAAPFWILGCFVDDPTSRLGAVGARGRHRIHRADRRVLGAGPRPLDDRGLGRRRRPHGRALRPVRHHRARRVDPDHRRVLRRSRLERDNRRRLRGLVYRQRRDVDGLLQYRRRACEPADRDVGRSRRAGAQRLHLSAYPDRRRHHRGRGRRRAGPAPSRRPRRPHRLRARPWRSWGVRRSI